MLGVNLLIMTVAMLSRRCLKTNFFVPIVGVQLAVWNCLFILWDTKRKASLISETDHLRLDLNSYEVVSIIMACQLTLTTEFLPNAIFDFILIICVEVYRIKMETSDQESVLTAASYMKLA